MQVLTGNDRFVGESYRMGGVGSLIGISNVATPRWGQLDIAGRAGQFDKAIALQAELEEISNLVFSEPIVEAVAQGRATFHNIRRFLTYHLNAQFGR